MLDVTAWVVAVWLKWTALLALGVGLAWLLLPVDSGWLLTVYVTAAVTEWFISRQLCREWAHQAHFSWWWAR